MKKALLEEYIQFYQNRIARYEEQLKDPGVSWSDQALIRDVKMQNEFWLFIALYSRGADLFKLREAFPALVESLAACKFENTPNPVNFVHLEGYVRALWLVSLAILLDVSDGLFEQLVGLVGQTGYDALYDQLVALRFVTEPAISTLLYPEPYDPLYQALQAPDTARRSEYLDQFLKTFYSGMEETYWYDLHLRKEQEFFGYWSFTLAAFIKKLDWPDVLFADNYFYPRDLTGRKLFRTWDDSDIGRADRLAYQQLKESEKPD